MPEEPPLRTMSVLVANANGNHTKTLKRPYFDAFDGIAAQDAALANRRLGYDHDLPQYPSFEARKRRDSMQDDSSSTSGASQTKDPVENIIATPPAKPKLPPPTVILSTEPSTATQEKSTTVPKELAIDGNAGFDPHRANKEADTIKTYCYKGRRYEVQGDEPEEWLKDVRVVSRHPGQTSNKTATPRQQSRGSTTPNSTMSGVGGRTRRTPRRSVISSTEHDERRRSGRPRRSAMASQQQSQDDLEESYE